MELTKYLNKRVQIILNNGFTYLGKCISADDDSIKIIDKLNREVEIKENSISLIQELSYV